MLLNLLNFDQMISLQDANFNNKDFALIRNDPYSFSNQEKGQNSAWETGSFHPTKPQQIFRVIRNYIS